MERWLLLAARVFENHFSCHVVLAAIATASSLDARSALADPASSPADLETLRVAANRALAEGRFASAHDLYRSILARDPDDPTALREAGRAAHAMRDFAAAVLLLQNAAAKTTTPDPELHYLLAEALWVLGRKSEARAMYSVARREIGPAPKDLLPRLWLARIHDRSGNRRAACALYNALAAETPNNAEVALTHAESHANAREWSSAEATLRAFLAVQPGHQRALEMLAWITEARGNLRSELELRQLLAQHSTTAEPVREYGRALERAGDWAGALETYRRAERLAGGAGDVALERALHRMAHRMAIEVAAGAIARTDSTANAIGGSLGVAVPFGRAHHFALGAWREQVSSGSRDGSAGELSGAVALNGAATRLTAGLELGMLDVASSERMPAVASVSPAAFGSVRRSLLDRHVELGLDGAWNTVWREAPLVELEGGRLDAATAHLWANGFAHRLVIDTGAQLRRVRFLPADMGDPRASQLHAWAGADWQLWGDATKQAAGEILDEELLQPTFLASSLVASYRHREAFATANPAFTERLVLADRASVDELALALRLALEDGRLALAVHGGAGYDRARALWLASGDFAMWIATGASSRLSVTFALGTEGGVAISGQRLSGGMSYHVDL